ncbi:hypothetical protein GDO86_009034, partial [Hymenochirus boettgeri]
GKRRKQRKEDVISSLTKRQKKHLKEFGEQHPFYDQKNESFEDESGRESEAESEPEQVNMYHRLLATLKNVSDEEEDESEEEEDDDDNDERLEAENEEEIDQIHLMRLRRSFPVWIKMEKRWRDRKVVSAPEEGNEFTDLKHESKFSLETNFMDDDEMESRPKSQSCLPKQKNHSCNILKGSWMKRYRQDQKHPKKTSSLKWPVLGQLVISAPLAEVHPFKSEKETDLQKLLLHKPLFSTWPKVNGPFLANRDEQNFTPVQKELFNILNSYRDVFYSGRTPTVHGEEIRHVYCLHALNHVLKANAKVLHNNSRKRDQKAGLDEEDLRDQGLTRPKVLIVVPFRESALRVVQILIGLMEVGEKKLDVSNKKRFRREYGSDPDERPPNLKRPEDYEAVFSGNIDDHFRIGVAILQKNMRLYAPFYSSDIIIASPLGLRTIIGTDGEKNRDFDFLSSIELLIIDQTDIFLMQNWEHVLHLMAHLNLQPTESHGVDFSRVRMWNLSNWAQYYRQTLLFSSLQEPQINSLFNKHCFNYSGQVAIRNVPITGSISHVVVQLPHVFQRLEADNLLSIIDRRFQFFTDKILPQYRDAIMSHTLIYIPSYFDYVRLRNYFKKEELNFTHICEYTDKPGISRARQFFLKGERQFLLMTERFHFYKRYTLKGIRNIIFYELPTYPHFYSEVCNMLKAWNREEEATWTCTVLYSKYDAQRLAAVVGAERAAQMLQSKKNVHLFVTGENS